MPASEPRTALTLDGTSHQLARASGLTWVHWWGHLTALTLDRMSRQLAKPSELMWAPLWEPTTVMTLDLTLALRWSRRWH